VDGGADGASGGLRVHHSKRELQTRHQDDCGISYNRFVGISTYAENTRANDNATDCVVFDQERAVISSTHH